MNYTIIVNFPANMQPEQKKQIRDNLYDSLTDIRKDIFNWNGFVDCIESTTGDYTLIAHCDNEEVRAQMQHLIDQNTISLKLSA